MNDILSEAFEAICTEAEEAEITHVSLYCVSRLYGGPEEGGWWYDHWELISSQTVPTKTQAQALIKRVQTQVNQLTQESNKTHGEHCLRQLEYCEARGIDDSNSIFGEVDGPGDYRVITEDYPGARITKERPHYE